MNAIVLPSYPRSTRFESPHTTQSSRSRMDNPEVGLPRVVSPAGSEHRESVRCYVMSMPSLSGPMHFFKPRSMFQVFPQPSTTTFGVNQPLCSAREQDHDWRWTVCMFVLCKPVDLLFTLHSRYFCLGFFRADGWS